MGRMDQYDFWFILPFLALFDPQLTFSNKKITFCCKFEQVLILFNFFSIYKCDVRIKHDQIDEMIPSKS